MGLLLATQIQIQPSAQEKLENESVENLGEIINSLNVEINKLRLEITDFQVQIFENKRKTANQNEIMNQAAESLNNLKIVSGLIPVKGEGISVEVIDKHRILSGYDLYELIQELKNGGAEVISVNGNRVVAQTSFISVDNNIFMDGTKLKPPYRIKSIGKQDVLFSGLTLPGGIIDALHSLSGVKITIVKEKKLEIISTRKELTAKYAKPELNKK